MRSNKVFKKALSLILCVVMTFGSAPLAGLVGIDLPSIGDLVASKAEATGKKITDYNVGDTIEFGWYPQSRVTDSSLISQLNAAAGDNKSWTSYGYYSNNAASDYMRYIDVILGSNKYRGVIFDSYRPWDTGTPSSTSTSNTNQYNNGYSTGTAYWFKYEPIKWRVLNTATGMVMSETILDSQAYNNYLLYSGEKYYGDAYKTYYANNYAESSIRKWLNNDFYNTAFSNYEKTMLKTVTISNFAYTDPRILSDTYLIDSSDYNSVQTEEKIYLPSYDDMTNTNYGFSISYAEYNVARTAQGSDYAAIQGYNFGLAWWLRSAGYYSHYVWHINTEGYMGCGAFPNWSCLGVRPVINLNTEAVSCNCKISSPSTTTISYGDSIVLHANIENLPTCAKVVWEASNGNFSYSVSSDGTTCTISPKSSGDTEFTAKIVDSNGKVLSSDTQKMTSKAGFWQKLVAFFKSLFGSNQVIPYTVKNLFR